MDDTDEMNHDYQSTHILCLFFFAEIADNASLSVEETGSSATESTDSIGSLRNSSPENAEKCVMREINRSSDAMSRLSPMVTGILFINKRFALNEMFQRNASKFAIFYV